MIRSLHPYPAMKDSGVPWLGQVPEHWRVARAKTLLQAIDLRSESGTEELLTVSSARGVVPRASADVTMFKAASYVGYKLCWPDDLVINSLWAWAHGLGVSNQHGIVSTAYGVYRSRDVAKLNPGFVNSLVRSEPFNWELQIRSKGIWVSRLQLTDQAFLDAPFPLPPPAEQTAIVRFLDHATRRIGKAIRAKQKLVKLLEEEKQVIIHRAVTRGLDPNVRLKPSGVEWLGDVPEHWEVRQIGRFARVGNGSTPSRGNTSYWARGTYPWLNSGSVNSGVITRADQFVTGAALRECHLPKVAAGSVLVAITGQGKTRGKCATLLIEATINQHIAFITPHKQDHVATTDFLRYVLTASYAELRRMSDDSGSTKGALTCEDLKHFRIAVPAVEAQQRIVEWIQSQTTRLEDAKDIADRHVGLLREYRTRLIADVVTGKLDVREAAAQLPDEAPESETSEEPEVPAEGDEDVADAEPRDAMAEDAEAV